MIRRIKHGGCFQHGTQAWSCGRYVAIEFQRACSRAYGGRRERLCMCSSTVASSCIRSHVLHSHKVDRISEAYCLILIYNAS